MLEGFLAIVACQVVGTVVADVAQLPVPGPVVGMLLLLSWLLWRRPGEDSGILRAGDRLLALMPLLFIPAGVGVIAWLGDLRRQWLPMAVGMVVPWAVGLLATAAAATLVLRAQGAGREGALDDTDELVVEAEEIEGVADGEAR